MNLDIDGVDWQIAHPGPRGTTRSPRIEVQVKSSSAPRIKDGEIHHSLRVDHFNHLAGPGFQIPRFLSVVIVPTAAEEYAICTDRQMQLSTAAYWISLEDRETLPTEPGDPASVSVRIPTRNLLTVETLGSLLAGDRAGDRGGATR
ncbi:hypothetical protein GCM10010436_26660 [Paractinoplanes durhamensis]